MRIVDSLPDVAAVLLSSMAFGSFAFVVISRWRTDATRGYVGFTAFCAGLLALLTLAMKSGLPAGSQVVRTFPVDLYMLHQYGLGAFAAAALVYPFVGRRPRASLAAALAGLVAAGIALAAAAFGWAPQAVDGVPLLVQLVMLSLVTGGSMAAVILGHWYLVTPKISDRPLVLQTRLLMGLVGLQVLLFIVWTTLGGGPGQGAFDAFSGGNLLLVFLRLMITLLFPLVLCAMAWLTARTRSMESATGLLYINLAAVMAGTIGAAALYFSERTAPVITVTVRLFAILRQQAGWRERELELPAGATIEHAWRELVGLVPALAASRDAVRFARNRQYASTDETLADGDELALIPPVAGGAAERLLRCEIVEGPIDDTLLAELRSTVPTASDGALVVFVGQTRDTPGTPAPGEEAEAARHAKEKVAQLEYEAFAEMALEVLRAIGGEIEDRFGVRRLAIVHRTGVVEVGEASVVIAAAAPHRGPAFDACRYAIEELKARAPIWKAEHFSSGSVWLGGPARSGPEATPEG